jgi:hypothetical protein
LITIVNVVHNAKKQRDSRQETRRIYVDLVLGFLSGATWRCAFTILQEEKSGSGESNKLLSKISIGDVLILSFNSISTCSGAVAVVWSALPVNTSIRCFEAGDLLCGLFPYCISSFESCFAVLIDPVLIYPNI